MTTVVYYKERVVDARVFLVGGAKGTGVASGGTLLGAISGISFNGSIDGRDADGSDLMNNTWSDDGAVYGPWGDGAGFDGASGVGMGIWKMTGSKPTSFPVSHASDVSEEDLNGKPYTILSINGNLYVAYANPGSYPNNLDFTTFSRSTDSGLNWTDASWDFTNTAQGGGGPYQDILGCAFLQQGQDHGDALDDYVYMYAVEYDDAEANSGISQGGKILLLRCDVSGGDSAITGGSSVPGNWEYWQSGTTWTTTRASAGAVITETNGVQLVCSAHRYSSLESIVLVYHHGNTGKNQPNRSNFVICVADHDQPMGPFTEIQRYTQGGTEFPEDYLTVIDFSDKWASGLDFTCTGSGVDNLPDNPNDAYVQISGSFSR